MSVTYDKERKTWFVSWREKNAVTGKTTMRRKRGFTSKKEAKAFEDETLGMRSSASFKQVMELYLLNLKGYANEDTINGKRRSMEMYASSLMPLNVRSIKKSMMADWKNTLQQTDLSVTTKNRVMQTVKAISKFGADYYDYPHYAKLLKPFPKSSDDVQEMRIISPSEFLKVAENCDNEVYRRFFIFLYHTGMRRGEAMALFKEDINGRMVSVNKSQRRAKTGRRPLKNVASKRKIRIDDKAYEAIEPLLETDGDYVFGEHAPLSATEITRHFEKALNKAGLPHYRVHDLRHSFVSNAILNGADIVTVSKYVGHSDTQQTLNTYSHLLKNSEDRLLAILNQNV